MRVARRSGGSQAGFVGYVVQANGLKFPWEPFASITATSPPDQWDALPEAAKIQIILGVGFLEWWSELRLEPGAKHYMKGGTPGYIPPFDATPDQLPHWIGLNLWDPFKFTSKMSPAAKEGALIKEVCPAWPELAMRTSSGDSKIVLAGSLAGLGYSC